LTQRPNPCEHAFVSDARQLAILLAALDRRLAPLPVGAEDAAAVRELALAGLLLDAGDGIATPTPAAVHYIELTGTS
jgi:hypothetical protein